MGQVNQGNTLTSRLKRCGIITETRYNHNIGNRLKCRPGVKLNIV
jgi:hypothetical protein